MSPSNTWLVLLLVVASASSRFRFRQLPQFVLTITLDTVYAADYSWGLPNTKLGTMDLATKLDFSFANFSGPAKIIDVAITGQQAMMIIGTNTVVLYNEFL